MKAADHGHPFDQLQAAHLQATEQIRYTYRFVTRNIKAQFAFQPI